jgi:hypothetical protein
VNELEQLRTRTRTRTLPPPGMLGEIVAAGRRRRRNGAAIGAALALALVIVGIQFLPGGGHGRETLMPANPTGLPRPSATGSLGTSRSAGTAPRPAASTLSGNTPVAAPGPGTSAVVTGTVRETPGARQPAQSGPAKQPSASGPVSRTRQAGAGPDTCTNVHTPTLPRGHSVGPCVTLTAADTGKAFKLSIRVCQGRQDGNRTLDFPRGDEVDWSITSHTGNRWDWQPARPIPAHSLRLNAGDCFVWQTSWNRLGTQGQPFPAGHATLTVHPTYGSTTYSTDLTV